MVNNLERNGFVLNQREVTMRRLVIGADIAMRWLVFFVSYIFVCIVPLLLGAVVFICTSGLSMPFAWLTGIAVFGASWYLSCTQLAKFTRRFGIIFCSPTLVEMLVVSMIFLALFCLVLRL